MLALFDDSVDILQDTLAKPTQPKHHTNTTGGGVSLEELGDVFSLPAFLQALTAFSHTDPCRVEFLAELLFKFYFSSLSRT